MGWQPMTTGERIRKMRRACRVTQSDVAKALGVTNTSVCNWEKGVCTPRAPILKLLADLFGCEVCNLTGVRPPPSFAPRTHLPVAMSLRDCTDADLLAELARRLSHGAAVQARGDGNP